MTDLETIKVFIVDDSAVVRQLLQTMLSDQSGIEVIGVASDPLFAIEKIRGNWPDVFILDVEMPRMDGISFLKKIMSSRPTPVVICSSFSSKGAETTLEALSAGAISYVTKPKLGVKGFLQSSKNQFVEAIRVAASSDIMKVKRPFVPQKRGPALKLSASSVRSQRDKVVAIGCSTGGTIALESILPALTPSTPGLVVVQHMAEKFTTAFANRLNSLCQIEVKEAEDGDKVRRGRALIAPGGKHMTLVQSGDSYFVQVKPGPMVNRHCPSVDVLFHSVAKCCSDNAVGFILTGMGSDGARGMKAMFHAGCTTYAQSEETCVVFGMPKEAIKMGGVKQTIRLDDVMEAIAIHSEV